MVEYEYKQLHALDEIQKFRQLISNTFNWRLDSIKPYINVLTTSIYISGKVTPNERKKIEKLARKYFKKDVYGFYYQKPSQGYGPQGHYSFTIKIMEKKRIK